MYHLVGTLILEEILHVWGQEVYGTPVPSAQFCYEPIIAQKSLLKNVHVSLKTFSISTLNKAEAADLLSLLTPSAGHQKKSA